MLRAVLLSLSSLLPFAATADHAPSSAPGRLAGVEVIDADTGRALPMYRHDGRWYVAGEPGREYEIRIDSRRPERLLAVTSVDGVNVVTGETANPRQSGYVLGAYGESAIEGWRKSLDRVARFYFTDLGDSYAARTDRPDDVGVIGVALFRERARKPAPPHPLWRKDAERSEERAAAESAAPDAKSHSRSAPEPQLGTGHGDSAWSQARHTEFERASKRPDEVVTIYYDSRRNLQARGVIPRERRWAHREDPRPFPAYFAPDPWR